MNTRLKIFILAIAIMILNWDIPAVAVMNGRDADLTQSRAAIFISLEGSDRTCTGVVVNPHLILTAAHCVDGVSSSASKIEVTNGITHSSSRYLNVVKFGKSPNFKLVANARSHEKEDENREDIRYDFAYIRVQQDLLETLSVQASDLPLMAPTSTEIQALLPKTTSVKGYGYGIFDRHENSGRKKEIRLALTWDEAAQAIRADSTEPKVGLCSGDSGGGLFGTVDGDKTYLFGVVVGIDVKHHCGDAESFAAYAPISVELLCSLQAAADTDLGISACPAVSK